MNAHPLHPAHNPITIGGPEITIVRARSAQRNWSDPVSRTQHEELAQAHAFTPAMFHDDLVPHHAVAPIAAAVCRDVPMRRLQSTPMAHYRNGSTNYSRFNNNIISSIHDFDLYEDGHHAYDAYGVLSGPRAMRQAPKLLTLDDYNLISLGYKPVMLRRLPWISLTGIVVTATNVFSGIIPLYGLTVVNGGPAWATWSYLVVGVMSTIVTLCLSELASAYPTTTGVHHWVYQLGSARRRAFLSWMVGWYTITSAVAVTASLAFHFSSVLGQLLVSIRKTTLTPATIVMFHLGVLFAWQMFNLIPSRGMGHLSILSGVFITSLAVALTSAMLSLSGIEPSMCYTPFTAFLNYSGSSSAMYAAISSTLMASFVFSPQDTIIRMAEETRRPGKTMPRLMISSSVYSLLVGLPLIIVLNYGIIKPIKGILDETIPGVKVILETLGNSAGTVFVSLVLAAMFCTGVVRMAMSIRIVYAFARDGGVPHSSYWNHLHPSRKTPERVSWLVTLASMCCIFPFFWGNSVAFQWIASLGCISANISFVIPLWMRLTNEGNLHFSHGSFKLGRYSRFLHIISVIWLVVLSLFLTLPSTFPLTKNNFNYAPIVLIVLTILYGISWFKARTDFTGGAKDISRASHRPPSGPVKDAYLQRQQQEEGGSLESNRSLLPMNAIHQPPQSAPQNFKASGQGTPSTAIKSTKPPHNTGTSPVGVIPNRTSSKKRPQLRSDPATPMRSNSNLRPRNGLRRSGRTSNATITSDTSNQSHHSSILGIPFSESPEVMHREVAIKKPEPPITPPRFTISNNGVITSESDGSATPTGRDEPELLLTTLLATNALTTLPEISIAPPTTTDSTEASASVSKSARGGVNDSQTAKGKGKGVLPPRITIYPRNLRTNGRSEGSPASDTLTARPLNAIDSIFNSGFGQANNPTGHTQDGGSVALDKVRFGKDRSPTPYPSSPVDTDDGALSASDLSTSLVENGQHMSPTVSLVVPSLDKVHDNRYTVTGKRGTKGPGSDSRSPRSIEETVSQMDIGSFQPSEQSTSRLPTLDGFPLLKSPSSGPTERLAESRPSQSLRLPDQLPLSRTPTIRHCEQEYGASFRMGDSDSDNISNGDLDMPEEKSCFNTHCQRKGHPYHSNRGMVAREGDSYTDCNSYYPVSSVSHSRLHALTPVSTSTGLFRHSNRDISTTMSDLRRSESRHVAHLPPQGGLGDKHEREGRRQDPIEHLLRKSREYLRQTPLPAGSIAQLQLQQLQRSRNVANWAQEQAIIQVKRAKHRTRLRVLRELRKYDPTAVLSIHSSDSSGFSDCSTLSAWSVSQSLSRSSSGGGGGGMGRANSRRAQNWNGGKMLELLQEDDEPLELSRLDTVIREQEEEEEEMPGMYMDTDDILSPSIEVESLGAGVGKSPYRV